MGQVVLVLPTKIAPCESNLHGNDTNLDDYTWNGMQVEVIRLP